MITSVRDLGTTLSHLQVLWIPRCSLLDLDGISTFSSLKELYVAYNSLSDLSQVGMLENLQLLDLEGNDVDDLVQVQYLGLCGKLQTLTLEGNPVCFCPNPSAVQISDYSYRAAVRELIPQLRYLDDVQVEEEGRHCSSCTKGDDWAVLRHSIRDPNLPRADMDEEEAPHDVRPCSRAASARLPPPSRSLVRLSSGSRPRTCSTPTTATMPGVLSPPGSRPGSADPHLATVAAETSGLTHGAGKILFCGNPVQALRARREKLMTAPTNSSLSAREFPVHVPEHTYDLEEPDGRERADVFAELRAWREQHSKRLQAIEKERSPQVLAIQHSDEEEGREDHSEDEDSRGGGTDSTDEEEERDEDTTATASYHKLPGIRARRLQRCNANHHLLPGSSCEPDTLRAEKAPGDPDRTIKQVQQLAHRPRPPPLITLAKGQIDPCAETVSAIPSPHTFRLLDRPTVTRPHTARAALQQHHLSHLLQPCRGRSQPK